MKLLMIFALLVMMLLLVSGCNIIDDIVIKNPKLKTTASATKVEVQLIERICAKKNCIKTSYSLSKSPLEFVLVGNNVVNEFLEAHDIQDREITKFVELIEVTRDNRGIKEVSLLVASNEVSEESGRLCQPFYDKGIDCQIQVQIPEGSSEIENLIEKGCFLAYGNIVPDPVDALCLIITFS